MARQFTLEEVLSLLNDLYKNNNAEAKEKASLQLGELQESVGAWTISDQLLQLNKDVESCYFASHTMRSKIQYSFRELPPETHDQLKESILNHASKVTNATPAAIAKQLCLALADLALQMPNWKNVAKDMIEKFGANQQLWLFLLELLTVLPEEVDSRALKLGDNRRKELTTEFVESSPLMLQFLTTILDSGVDESLQGKVLNCLASWISISAVQQESLANSRVMLLPFQALASAECSTTFHEAACDCVCAALFYCSEEIEQALDLDDDSDGSDSISPNNIRSDKGKMNEILQQTGTRLAEGLCQGVMSLLDAYHLSIATEDLDKTTNFCRIFTEMAESFLDLIVYLPTHVLGTFNSLELLITCVGHHQYEIAEMTFNFWYRLSDILYKENQTTLNDVFKPYVQRLIIAVCRHCQFDPDHEGIPKKHDDFADFRDRASELIKDIAFIVGSSPVFRQMYECLTANQTEGGPWSNSEAALFIMSSVARNILPDDPSVVEEVLTKVLIMPEDSHLMLRYTSIILIGELCEWINKHPMVLDPLLQFLLVGLQKKELSTPAARALQKICEQCTVPMQGQFDGMVQVLNAVESLYVSNEAALELIRGTVLILTFLMCCMIQKLCQKI